MALRAQVVVIAAGAESDVADVLPHVPNLVEEELEGSRVLGDELVVAVQDRAGIGADLFANSYEGSVIVGHALEFPVLEDGQGHLIWAAFGVSLAKRGSDFGGV